MAATLVERATKAIAVLTGKGIEVDTYSMDMAQDPTLDFVVYFEDCASSTQERGSDPS